MKAVVAALGSLLIASAGCDPDGLGRSNPDFLVIGHRGAPNSAPENTLPSFDVAVALGAGAIELDVCATSDDVLVVWHDADPDDVVALTRQAGAEGLAFVPSVPELGSEWRRPVRELTLSEFRRHYGYAESGGLRIDTVVIPLLDDVLDWARDETRLRALYLDLKVGMEAIDLVTTVMADVATDPALSHVNFYFSSVRRDVVDAAEAARKDLDAETVRVLQDVEGTGALSVALDAGLRDVMMGLTPTIPYSDFKKDVADAVGAREEGRVDSVTVWTFDSQIQLAEMLYYSVDGVMTNEPARLHAMWQDSLE